MRHRTVDDVRADLEALGCYVGSPKLIKAITAMLNNPAFPPKVKADPAEDCVVHWAPGWATYMRYMAS